jgi:hypothetical protein
MARFAVGGLPCLAALAPIWIVMADSAPTLAAHSRIAGPRLTVVAANLNNPRKIFLGPGRTLYVAEAGKGGSNKCFGTGPDTTCVGLTGSITKIVNGAQSRVVTGLVSWAIPAAERAAGPADVLVRGRRYFILLQDGFVNSKGANALGPDGATAGDLVSSPPGKAAPMVIADLGAFEAAHNPDRGAGPGRKLGSPSIDSDPYAFAAYRGGFAIVDAGANDLLWLSPEGVVSVLAVFPTQTEKLTKAVARQIGLPPTLSSISVQSVPSSVTVGPDGALYVGELTGRPFQPGTARIWRIVPGKQMSLYASGFTNISDLAFDGRNLLVLEIAANGLLDQRSPGALIRLAPEGGRTVLASAGLVAPTGLAVGNGSIYISNYGLFPGTGPGRHGEVVSLPSK